jgi:hypothetical protein
MSRETVSPITLDELCELPCAECGERADDFVLQGRCHPGEGVHVTFEKARRMFRIVCAVCDQHVVSITTKQVIQ